MSRLVCLLLFALAAPRAAALTRVDERPSLQELRRELEQRRLARRAELEPRVEELLARLAALPTAADEDELADLSEELAALPAEAAPLLLPGLDPGPVSAPAKNRAASMIQSALVELGLRSITPELAELARTGSPRGRTHAVALLGRSEDKLDAGEALRELWKRPPTGLGPEIAEALLRLDGEANLEVLAAALGDSNKERVGWAVGALVELSPPGADEALAKLLERKPRARDHIDLLLEFYLENSDSFEEPEALGLLALLSWDTSLTEGDAAIFEALPELRRSSRGAWIPALRSQEGHRTGKLLEAIRICLARSGERNARRELLKESEEWIAKSKNSPDAYLERARLFMALREYSRAANDFEEAYELFSYPSKRRWQTGVNIARAHILDDHLRQASLALRELNLTPVMKRELAEDPDFAPLREHATYGRVLD